MEATRRGLFGALAALASAIGLRGSDPPDAPEVPTDFQLLSAQLEALPEMNIGSVVGVPVVPDMHFHGPFPDPDHCRLCHREPDPWPNFVRGGQNELWPTHTWSRELPMTFVDVKRMRFADKHGRPASGILEQLRSVSIETVWKKALAWVAYLGMKAERQEDGADDVGFGGRVFGSYGLLNNPNVSVHRGDLTYYDFDFFEEKILSLGANTLLVRESRFIQHRVEALKNAMSERGLALEIISIPDAWFTGIEGRAVLYRNHPNALRIVVISCPSHVMTVPSTNDGGSYKCMYTGCFSCLVLEKPETVLYLDPAE